MIALVVGVVLTAVNQLDVIARGEATAWVWVKCVTNFLVPFVVSNLGLMTGRARESTPPAAPAAREWPGHGGDADAAPPSRRLD